jgi:hypothetical protein
MFSPAYPYYLADKARKYINVIFKKLLLVPRDTFHGSGDWHDRKLVAILLCADAIDLLAL